MDLSRLREAMRSGAADPFIASRYYKKDSEAPDYTPMSNASIEAAQIADRLGRDQMAQAQRNYDSTMVVAKPVVDAQLGLMAQSKAQGDDYYNYMVSQQRPLEQALNAEVLNQNKTAEQDAVERKYIYDTNQNAAAEGEDYRQKIASRTYQLEGDLEANRQAILAKNNSNQALNEQERALITGGDTGVYEARKGDIEESVGRALADSRSGQAATTNQMIRQAARYGYSPEKLAAMAGSQGLGMASQQAAAANGTRQAGIQNARSLLGANYDMRNAEHATAISDLTSDRDRVTAQGQLGIGNLATSRSLGLENAGLRANAMLTSRNLRLADDARNWGKRMDTAGLYRGLAGASQGAYGLAGQMGSSAVQNQSAPGNAMMAQNQGAMGTTMQGQQLKLQGLGSVLNAQTNFATSQGNAGNPLMGMAGAALGGWASGGFQGIS